MDNEPWAEQEIQEYRKNNQLLIKKNKAMLERGENTLISVHTGITRL